jgi:putative ABC transport system substrate-binding protein
MQFNHLKRREFITLLGGAAMWPLAVRAQPLVRIGFLGSATPAGSAKAIDELRTGLRELGYVEGRNIVIEFRWAEESYDRLPQLVRELIATRVDLLITHGTPGTRVAKQATSTIPIVMAISGDAVATGLVSSLARPEANVTGSTFFLPELNAKRLKVLKEACPSILHPTALSNPDNPVSRPIIPAMQSAATALSLTLEVARPQSLSEFDRAFEAMAGNRVDFTRRLSRSRGVGRAADRGREHRELPPSNLLGVKGLGEGGAIAPPVVMRCAMRSAGQIRAVCHAAAPGGAR